jgi:hypothetical protein
MNVTAQPGPTGAYAAGWQNSAQIFKDQHHFAGTAAFPVVTLAQRSASYRVRFFGSTPG